MKSLTTVPETTAIEFHRQAASRLLTSDMTKTLSVELIVRDNESITFRSITHKNVSEIEKKVFAIYRVAMADAFMKAIRYLKTAITWEKDMVVEFVDVIVSEFPNWKPEDFFLFLDMAKTGKFSDKYEHSVDFPTLIGWAHKYDELKLRAIESERVVEIPEAPAEPGMKYTQEEIDRATQDLYQMLNRKDTAKKLPKPEPEFMQLQRMAFNAYQRAKNDYLMAEGVPENQYLRESAREQFEKENPIEQWCEDWIKNHNK